MERKLTGSTLFPCGPATRRPGGVVRWLLLFFVFGSRMIAAGAQGMPEAAPPRLQIAAIERSDFPTVGLNLIATSPSSERREIVEGLRLWENGVPVADFTLEPVTVGVELFLLLDLEPAWADTGEDGVTSPLLLVRDSLLRLAGRHLERDRDRLWVGAGDGEETEWLVQQAPDPGSLINALDEVEAPPERGSAPPDPQALLAMALDSAEATPDETGRFRAIVLFTTGEGLSATVLQGLAERARASQLPVFVVLVGPPPLSTTLENAAWITLPTRGGQLHLASAEAADDLYALLAGNAEQTQLRYQTFIQAGGVYPVRVALGAEEAKRRKESNVVVNAIAAHHEEEAPQSLYAGLVMAADAISASRPGARRETLERYIKRLERLENLATQHGGVQRAFAIQAGREVRILVDAKKVTDQSAARLSQDIAHEIEDELQYPGEIVVTVIRESRFQGVAH